MKKTIFNYIFDASAQTIQLLDYQTINLAGLYFIINQTTGDVLYNVTDPAKGATATANVITLEFDTTSMSDSNDIVIIYDDGLPLQVTDSSLLQLMKDLNDTSFNDTNVDPPVTIVDEGLHGEQSALNSHPVVIATEQVVDLYVDGGAVQTPPVGTPLLLLDALRYRSVSFQVTTGAVGAGVVTFEETNNLIQWNPKFVWDLTNPRAEPVTSLTLAASTSRYFACPLHMRYFRVRVTTAVTTSFAHVTARFSMTPFSTVYQPVSVDGWGGTTVTGAALPGVNVSQIAGTATVTSGIAGMPAVGGNVAPASLVTANPVTIGGVDDSGLVRRKLTDALGNAKAKLYPGGIDEKGIAILLDQILWELRFANYLQVVSPLVMSQANGQYDYNNADDFRNDYQQISS